MKALPTDGASRAAPVQGRWTQERGLPPLPEVKEVNEKTRAKRLMEELSRMLVEVESLGALVAAAHLDTAIETLAKEFDIQRNSSGTD